MIMKKLFFLSVLCAAVFTAKAQNPGDVNKDGIVNSADVVMVYNIITNGWTEPGADKTFTVNGVSFTMKAVEGGTFNMGATPEQQNADKDEAPVHEVTLSDYMIGETEVTQALWEAVMGSNPSSFVGADKPVERVTWFDCKEFILKLNTATNQNFRFPTEAEWEYAARGGNKSQGYQYCGSNNLDDVAWYENNSDESTHPVKTKQPNELGIYDMSGNVYEWCLDWKGDYKSSAQTDPQGPGSGTSRVIRGGSWYMIAGACRSTSRNYSFPGNVSKFYGFRLALSE